MYRSAETGFWNPLSGDREVALVVRAKAVGNYKLSPLLRSFWCRGTRPPGKRELLRRLGAWRPSRGGSKEAERPDTIIMQMAQRIPELELA
jgi:hypothetical protein